MKSHPSLFRQPRLKSTKLVAVLLVAFLALCAVSFVSSTAQSTQKEERELEDKIPKHLPIKVKVKNLNSKKWTRDVEVEVTNTGDKPIYYLRLGLFFGDVRMENGDYLGFTLKYGRPDLYLIENKATPEDMPIRPGETYSFKAPKSLANYWEGFRTKHKMAHPKKIGIQFHALNYGDGTGFHTLGGLPVPAPGVSKSSCGEQRNRDTLMALPLMGILNRPPDAPIQSLSSLPVRFLPAMFSQAKIVESAPNISMPQSGLCCPGTACFKMRPVLGGNCFCSDDPPVSTEDVIDCNAFGDCGTQFTSQEICDIEGHTCTNFFILPCPTISPTPTPDSTPTPTPTPCDPPEATRPNDSCEPFGPCPPVGTRGWMCASCPSGFPVNKPVYGDYGCPDGYYNNDNNCCVPVTASGGGGGILCTTPGINGSCPPGTYPNDFGMCCAAGGGGGDICPDPPAAYGCGAVLPETACPYTIYGFGSCYSPVLVDVAGDGFRLTDARRGVRFDIDGNPDHLPEQVSWTAPGSDDAWLALDRNRNGMIDSGRELFGNLTLQPASAEGNGFIALAQYDRAKNGGNEDGQIDARDGFFALLRLWRDANHNGVSEAGELHPLPALGVTGLGLKYQESKRTDEFGNAFRYRAKVVDTKEARVNRWAWDVFLVVAR